MRTITLKDLARILGVSVTTVSKALKDYPDISEKTKREVKDLAKKLNYKPNIHAVTLRSQKSKTIGVIVPKVQHYFFSEVVNGLIKEAESKGYLVIILMSEDSLQSEKEQVRLLIDKRVDGILMALSSQTQAYDQEHIMDILANEIQLVLFDRISSGIPCSKVTIDDQKASYEAVKYLLDSGCKKILFMGGSKFLLNYRKRLNGYIQALTEAGISEDQNLIFHCESHDIQKSTEYTMEILNKDPSIDAVFAATDILALGVLSGIQRIGKKIPQEISIFGFSNWFVTEYTNPTLSTVNQPSTELGKIAMELLLEEIHKKETYRSFEHQTIEIPTELIIRESTKNSKKY